MHGSSSACQCQPCTQQTAGKGKDHQDGWMGCCRPCMSSPLRVSTRISCARASRRADAVGGVPAGGAAGAPVVVVRVDIGTRAHAAAAAVQEVASRAAGASGHSAAGGGRVVVSCAAGVATDAVGAGGIQRAGRASAAGRRVGFATGAGGAAAHTSCQVHSSLKAGIAHCRTANSRAALSVQSSSSIKTASALQQAAHDSCQRLLLLLLRLPTHRRRSWRRWVRCWRGTCCTMPRHRW